ncbi:MAG: hypothetical protein K2X41_13510 [Hyphomicrobium sp.]|nr:hypothetical protein [Hyphomicrobium sp.]
MKTIIKTTLAALALVVGASASQAQPGVPVWHFPYKGAPYATQAEPAVKAAPVKIVRHGKHVHKLIAGKTQVIR